MGALEDSKWREAEGRTLCFEYIRVYIIEIRVVGAQLHVLECKRRVERQERQGPLSNRVARNWPRSRACISCVEK